MAYNFARFEHDTEDTRLQPIYAKLSEMILHNEIRVGSDGIPPSDPDGGELAELIPPNNPPENEGALPEAVVEQRLGSCALSKI